MARRGVARNSVELKSVQRDINEGYEEDNIYENQAVLKQHLNYPHTRLPCIGQEGKPEQYECLQNVNPPTQQEVFEGDKKNFEIENYEPLQGSEKQADRNDDDADAEDYKDVYLTVLEDNNLPPATDRTGKSEDLYDDIVTSKASKRCKKSGAVKKSLIQNNDENDYKEEKQHNSEFVSTKAFRYCSLVILFISLIAFSALILVILIILGVISIKGVNTCDCASDIKKLKAQLSALQASPAATTATAITAAITAATTKTAATTINPTVLGNQTCPPGWRYFQNSCYYMHTNVTDLSNANKSCISLQSNLLSIETKAENDFVTSTYLQCNLVSYVSEAWLGLIYQGNINTLNPLQNYKWDSGKAISYSAFTNVTTFLTKTCFRVSHDRKWHSTMCNKTSVFICEGAPAKVSYCHIP